AMLQCMCGNRVIWTQRRGKNEPYFVLLQDIRSLLTPSSFRSRISNQTHAKRCSIVIGGLFGVADVELNVIYSVEWQEVLLRRRLHGAACFRCDRASFVASTHFSCPSAAERYRSTRAGPIS